MIPVSVHDWTADTDPIYRVVLDVLSEADIDLDRLTMTPDRTFTLATQRGRIAFGVDSHGNDGEWWTATAYEDDSEVLIYEGDSVIDLAATLVRR